MGSSLLLSLALRAAAPAPLGDQHGAEDSFRISSSGPSVDVERGFCAEVSGSATTANWSRPPHDRPRLSSGGSGTIPTMPRTTIFSFGDIVLVPFPFTDQAGHKKRPAVVVSSRAYNREKPDLVLMAVTSQVRSRGLGEVEVTGWQAAGLLKPSVIKPVLTTIEKRLVLRRLGRLKDEDHRLLRAALAVTWIASMLLEATGRLRPVVPFGSTGPETAWNNVAQPETAERDLTTC